MSRYTLRNLCTTAIAAAGVLAMADPVFAQDKAQTVFEMFFLPGDIMGMAVTWLLILMSMAVMALVLKHTMENRSGVLMPSGKLSTYEEMIQNKQFREAIELASADHSAFGKTLHASLSEAANGYGAMERAIEEEADLIASRKVRAVEPLAVMGAIGPMIGLFGTVYGMIVAFQTIVAEGGSPDPASLAAGISTALVTTFWGLIVGIPAVAATALVRNKIEGVMVEVIIQTEMLISPFSPAAKKAAKSKTTAG